MIAFFFYLAILNKAFIDFADSPTYLDIKSEELTEKKVESAYVAHALAKKVLPVPGGPYNNIPFHGFRNPTKISGNFNGRIIASYNDYFANFKPATSLHFTFGFSYIIAPLKASFLY